MSSPLAVQSLRVSLFKNGLLPIPIPTGKKEKPRHDWQQTARSLTSETASQWPDGEWLNTAILCDGLAVVDVDTDGGELAAWIISLALERLGRTAIRSRSNSPRAALLYRYASSGSSSANVIDNARKTICEVRGQGKYILVDGLHPSGCPYEWNCDLKAIRRDDLPLVSTDQLGDFLTEIAKRTGGNASRMKQQTAPAPPVPQTNVTDRERSYAKAALDREVEKLSTMRGGQHRNEALNTAAHSMGTLVAVGWIDAQTMAFALLGAAIQNGYVAKRGEQAARNTITSGYSAGMLKPRAPLTDDEGMDISQLRISGKSSDEILNNIGTGGTTAIPKAHARRSVALTGLAGVQAAAVEWHWKGYLPSGMLTLLCGAGGTGKSTLAFSFAATITRGGSWPDGQRCEGGGNVLIWSSEDDLARTIKPRLVAAGADITRISAIEGTTNEMGETLAFDPAKDMGDLRAKVREVGSISLLIIDPIVSAVAGDMHKANDVRRSLQPIVDFAAELNCAVLGISHFAKNTSGRNATERVIGSQAFAALARMVLVTAKEEDSATRVFTRAKSNISPDDGGIHYTIEAVMIPDGIETTRVVWGETIEGNARSILSTVEGDEASGTPLNKIQEAMKFLRVELANGPMPARELLERARRDFAIHERLLRRAGERIGVVVTKAGFQGAWVWSYPLAPGALTSRPMLDVAVPRER
jgi:hypothetical protein